MFEEVLAEHDRSTRVSEREAFPQVELQVGFRSNRVYIDPIPLEARAASEMQF
jgi:hypothetical protein